MKLLRALACGLAATVVVTSMATGSSPASAGLAPGTPVAIDTLGAYQYGIAHNPERNEYLAVYRPTVASGGPSGEIMAVRLDATGAVLSGPTVVADDFDGNHGLTSISWFVPRVVYNAAQNQYLLVVARSDVNGGGRQQSIYGRLISDLGVPASPDRRLAQYSADNTACVSRYPDVVVDPNTGGYLMTHTLWHATNKGVCDDLAPYERKVLLVPLSASLAEGPHVSVPTSSDPRNAFSSRLAYNAIADQFMLTQLDEIGAGTARIFSSELDQVAVIDIADFPANTAGGTGGIAASHVAAADPTTGNWLVAVSTNYGGKVVTYSIDAAGNKLRPSVTTDVTGIPTDLVAIGDGEWVVTTDTGQLAQVRADGTVASNRSIVDGSTIEEPAVAYNGDVADPLLMALGAVDDRPTVFPITPFDEAVVPLEPGRVLETRSGPGAETIDGDFVGGGRLAAGAVVELDIAGRAGVPADADAVMLNVTAIFPDGPGFLTVYPCDAKRPNTSNVNYAAGAVLPNAVLAKLDADGRVCIYTLVATDIVTDVNGYVPDGGSFRPIVPGRVLETRSGPGADTIDGDFVGGGRLAAGAVVELDIAGRAGVPADADAVMLNVTAILPDAPGFITVYPCDAERPNTSNVNYAEAGLVVPNAVLAKLDADGRVCIYTLAATDIVTDACWKPGRVPAPTPSTATSEPSAGRTPARRSNSPSSTVAGYPKKLRRSC